MVDIERVRKRKRKRKRKRVKYIDIERVRVRERELNIHDLYKFVHRVSLWPAARTLPVVVRTSVRVHVLYAMPACECVCVRVCVCGSIRETFASV